MYKKYFGLTESPFSIAPNPEYLYMTERHQEALAHLYHSLESDAGFVLLTGDIGTGKTTICRSFLDKLPSNTNVAFILNPFLSGKELLHVICQELNISELPDNATLRQLIHAIYNQLLKNHSQDKKTVLLIDEAQHLHPKVLELIRLLTNLETDTQKLLKIILVGQPELNDTLAKPELTQLAQRIIARYHISPLSLKETNAYIDYRLRMSGYMSERKLFPLPVVKRIYHLTKGVPRLINTICDRALLGAYSQNLSAVDLKILAKAVTELKGQRKKKSKKIPQSWIIAATVVMLLLAITTPLVVDKVQPGEYIKASVTGSVDREVQDIKLLKSNKLLITSYYKTLTDASIDLISVVKKNLPSRPVTCDNVEEFGWECRSAIAVSWDTVREYNRPAVITLNNADGEDHYLAITGMSDTHAQVLSPKGIELIALTELRRQWSGEFIYLWQPPKGFKDSIFFNSRVELVNWLADAFAKMDGRKERLASEEYNSLLRQRVMLFQRDHQLEEDGIAGVETLLKLNEKLGVAITLSQLDSNSKR